MTETQQLDPQAVALEAFMRLNDLADPLSPWAVRVAATLRLPDLIAQGAADTAALAQKTGLPADRLVRLMRYLTHRGVFTVAEDDSYGLTPVSMLLCEGAPGGQRDFLDLDGAVCRLDRVAVNLLDALRSDEPAYRAMYGRDAWEDLSAQPALAATFDRAMEHKSHLMAPGIVAGYDWASVGDLVDVGGGKGVILAEILRANPSLRGSLLDLPGTSEAGKAIFDAAGVSDRARVIGGDFFTDIPAGAGAYLMVNVLHDWDDVKAEAILRAAAEAAGPAGRVIIGEFIVNGAGDQKTVTRWDLLMLLGASGRERTQAEFATLAGRAGLRIASITPTPTGINLIECVPIARAS